MTASWKTLAAGISVFALAACGGDDTASSTQGDSAATADPAAQEIADTRHEGFEDLGEAFKTISDQLKTGEPDIAAIQASAAVVSETAAKIPDWFPEGTAPSDGVETDALNTIWEKPEDFAAAITRLQNAAPVLVSAAESGDAAAIGEAFKQTGGACKNCHESFRADDD